MVRFKQEHLLGDSFRGDLVWVRETRSPRIGLDQQAA
jgi:hypothetical protein